MAKFYIYKIDPIKYDRPDDGKAMIKFGCTWHGDAAKRYDQTVDDGYVKFPYYEHFRGFDKPKASKYFANRDGAEALEQEYLHERFPPKTHKVWLEDYLIDCPKHEYDNTGVTEIRLLTRSEYAVMIQDFYDNVLTEEDKHRKDMWKKRTLGTSDYYTQEGSDLTVVSDLEKYAKNS